ncbi:ubiquinol oxidase subunit II, cyanide insensitive [Bacterioplanes sanyensis]|uniref:cytochrome d ubiquinol oxidase subunit II n=1 Tax=Bacterioplanes sanyensis TaxID=1249553 RepID=UPI00167831D8|nr:cytochrome d ubiquinol oxidase subunit II [Bacterioplanes sanyensis]GGY58350.1 ubiquinol oxidase subunit II, cyanide insensitive [Bacterioplanes sanyensis]
MFDLAVIWFALIVFAILMYIVMDGFDLGVGMLFAMVDDSEQRDRMVNSVAPVWDGNETWLVLGGAGLMGAFPLAYAQVLEALTAPLLVMLLALLVRGVAFEYRFKAPQLSRHWWDKGLFCGSWLATFCQGLVLGAFIQGAAAGQSHWLTPFSLFCGVALTVTYTLLGAVWLIIKMDGALQQRMRQLAHTLLWQLLICMAVVSAWTPLTDERIAARWFGEGHWQWLWPVPVLAAWCALQLRTSLQRDRTYRPFLLALALVVLGFAGLGISLWPYLVPPQLTLWQAAAPASSLRFMLVGAVCILPLVLAYTAWSYYVFRGKTAPGEGYH